MSRKLVLLISMSVVLALLVGACGTPTAEPTPEQPAAEEHADEGEHIEEPTEPPVGEPYRIGVFFSVTGPASSLGVPERDTALMVAEQVNAAGGIEGPDGLMHPLEIIMEDDQTDATEAVLIVKRLIEEENVPVIVGGTASGISLAVIDTITEAQVPFISNASSSAIIQPVEERHWIFKTPQTNLPVAQIQGDWMVAKGIAKVASFGVNNGFGVDSMGAFRSVMDELGIEIVWEGTFEPGDTDFSAQLTQIAGSDAEALVVHATPGEGAPLTVQARDLALNMPIVHNHGIGNRAFIDLAGDAAEGVLFPIGKLLVYEDLPATDPQKGVLTQYIADYTEFTDGATPSTFGGHAWDSMQMAIMALSEVGPDSAAIRDYLEGIQNFAGISGVFNLSSEDHNGIGKETLVMVEIKNGGWEYVPPATYAQAPTGFEPRATGAPYKIGVFFSVTGPASSLGVPERDTALMLVDQVNARGGLLGPDGMLHPIEIILEDDQTDATEAVLIVKRLLEEEQVPIVVGGTASGISLAVIDTFSEAETPFISNASSSAIIQPVEERYWIFKTPQTNLPVAQVQGDWMVANGITKIASFGVNNGFGVDSMGALQQVAADLGIEIVWEGTFEPGDTDFTAQLTQIAGSGAEALIVHATPGEGAPLTVQFRDLALDMPILHNHGIGNQAFIDLAGDASEGVLFPIGKLLVADSLPDTDPQKATLLKYVAEYTDYTGATPSTFGGHAWDSMQMAFSALQAVGPDPAGIRDYIESIQNFAGISGIFNLSATDHNGIGKESLVLVEIRDGTWQYVAPEDYASASAAGN